ncbi:MAG: hypothetical protein GTO63_31845 [Anaerolineae bacterium]|nr:hypothetical protein [Anaerolineae bacterium]NIN99271.1 hypothetical protein [Anaerolineae bacterium]NIQ82110.1 hypothetical protein [Anaerolineae bacterium]
MKETLLVQNQLEEHGYRGRVVSTQRLADLEAGIEGHNAKGLIDGELYEMYLAGFEFDPPDDLPDSKSVIIVAVPNAPTRITFAVEGQRLPVFVPPSYLHFQEIHQQVQDLLAEALGPLGYRVAKAIIPKKLLAVRSGLARYGKNNICYVPGLGSFHVLVSLWSDLPCPQDSWREPQMLEKCQDCTACLRKCPTGAITSERFLLRAERCITFHNEKPTDIPFAEWIDPSGHNCLVGCFHCQRVCPENKDLREWIQEGEESFSEEETTRLLGGVPLDRLPGPMVEKLQRLDLVGLLDVVPRNLEIFVSRTRGD